MLLDMSAPKGLLVDSRKDALSACSQPLLGVLALLVWLVSTASRLRLEREPTLLILTLQSVALDR